MAGDDARESGTIPFKLTQIVHTSHLPYKDTDCWFVSCEIQERET